MAHYALTALGYDASQTLPKIVVNIVECMLYKYSDRKERVEPGRTDDKLLFFLLPHSSHPVVSF